MRNRFKRKTITQWPDAASGEPAFGSRRSATWRSWLARLALNLVLASAIGVYIANVADVENTAAPDLPSEAMQEEEQEEQMFFDDLDLTEVQSIA